MPLPAPLLSLSSRVNDVLPRQAPSKGLTRKARLGVLHQSRAAVHAWRDLNKLLVTSGCPESGTRLVCDPVRPPDVCGFDPERQVINMAWGAKPLGRMDLPSCQEAIAPIMVLLHEQAHARLHFQGHLWMDRWPDPLCFLAHPVWMQLPGHPGWCHFNELYADVSAAAWMMALSACDERVIELVNQLMLYRAKQAKIDPLSFSGHETSKALSCLLSTIRLAPKRLDITRPEGIEILARQCATNAFEEWVSAGGAKRCERFIEQSLVSSKVAPIGLLGLSNSMPSSFRPHQKLRGTMEKWAVRAPHHPIFRFPQAHSRGRFSVSGV